MLILSRSCRIVLFLLAAATPSMVRAAAEPAADHGTVALPPYIVEEAVKGPPWRFSDSTGYEVLSKCHDSLTAEVMQAYLRLHHLLEEILPERLRLKTTVPRTLILYDEELSPAASREVILRMMNQAVPVDRPRFEMTEPIDPGRGGRGGRGGGGGFTMTTPAPPAKYSFLPNLRLWDRDAMALFVIVRPGEFSSDTVGLTPSYVSHMLKNRLPALPPWFVNGFLELYPQVRYRSNRLIIEPQVWISKDNTAALRKDPAKAGPLIPLSEFFTGRVRPQKEGDSTEQAAELWRTQGALLIRWAFDGDEKRREGFWKLVEHSSFEVTSEGMFQRYLGLNYADAQAQLTAYRPQALRRSIRLRPARPAPKIDLALRDATDAQIARIKGDWERLEIAYVKELFPSLTDKYHEQARRTMLRAYERDVRDPRLLEVLGLLDCDTGNDEGALRFLEAASGLGPLRPRACYELARLRFAAARAAPGEGGRLSVLQTADVLRPLFAAREKQPPLPEVYELIGDAWTHSVAAPTRAHLRALDEGIFFFPRRTSLIARAAALYQRHGFQKEAATLTRLGLRVATEETERELFAQLEKQLAGAK